MNKVKIWYEHEKINYTELNGLSVDRLKSLKKNNISIFDFYKDHLKVKNYIGFALVDDYQINVFPKILKSEEDSELKIEKWRVLLKFLDIYFGLKESYNDNLITKILKKYYNKGLFEIFIFLFSNELLKEIESGVYKEYVNRCSEENFLRGKLLLVEQIKKLPYKWHRLSVEYHDFLEDNPLNQLFYAAIRLSRDYTNLTTNKSNLSKLIQYFSNVSIKRVKEIELDKIRFNRLNERFRTAFQLALILLRGFGVKFAEEESYGFFEDMNSVFEKYVFESIKEAFPEFSVEKTVIGSLIKDGILYRLEPDIIIKDKNIIKLIIDVKYKEIKNGQINMGDLYQVYAYSKMVKTDVVLIYPKSESFNADLDREEMEFFDSNRLIILPFEMTHLYGCKKVLCLPPQVKKEIEALLS